MTSKEILLETSSDLMNEALNLIDSKESRYGKGWMDIETKVLANIIFLKTKRVSKLSPSDESFMEELIDVVAYILMLYYKEEPDEISQREG